MALASVFCLYFIFSDRKASVYVGKINMDRRAGEEQMLRGRRVDDMGIVDRFMREEFCFVYD